MLSRCLASRCKWRSPLSGCSRKVVISGHMAAPVHWRSRFRWLLCAFGALALDGCSGKMVISPYMGRSRTLVLSSCLAAP